MSNISRFSEQISDKFSIFSFSLVFARNKRINYILFFSMFLPTIAMILLLNFTTEDFSGGRFWLWHYRIYFRVGLFFLVSLVALLVGTDMYRQEINDETIVYIMTRPIRRERIFLEKYFAYLLISFIIVTPGLIIAHFTGDIATRLFDTSFELTYRQSAYNLLYELIGAYMLLTGLGAVFVSTGLWLKRPLLINLIIAFGVIIEAFLLDLISNQFEPVYIAQNLVADKVVGFSVAPDIQDRIYRFTLGPEYPVNETIFNFIIVLIITLFLGLRGARRKQIV